MSTATAGRAGSLTLDPPGPPSGLPAPVQGMSPVEGEPDRPLGPGGVIDRGDPLDRRAGIPQGHGKLGAGLQGPVEPGELARVVLGERRERGQSLGPAPPQRTNGHTSGIGFTRTLVVKGLA